MESSGKNMWVGIRGNQRVYKYLNGGTVDWGNSLLYDFHGNQPTFDGEYHAGTKR